MRVALLLLGLGMLVLLLISGSKAEHDVLPAPPAADPALKSSAASPPALVSEFTETGTVTRIVDGDTVDVDFGGRVERVRYLGIDTPESVHPERPVECFSKEAATRNRELVEGRTVKLLRDITDRDRYGRLLRYVFVEDTFVNEELVRGGFAQVVTYPPDVAFQERFLARQREAREAFRGLWGGCDSAADASEAAEPLPACGIKGNINSAGEYIFHVPGCGSYEKTVVNEASGERWFCSEGEAEAAGWRKARNCP